MFHFDLVAGVYSALVQFGIGVSQQVLWRKRNQASRA